MKEQNTSTRKAESIAARIRHAKGPETPMADLSAQALRLNRSIAVLEKWTRAAVEDSVGELAVLAETTLDQAHEELSRVVWAMDLETRRREYREMGSEGLEEVARYALLSDTLLQAYCVLASAPVEVLSGDETDASERTCFSLMGALLVAQDAADTELKRAEAKLQA